jgi:predicted transposase/invertase (TIGR01784 family)
MAQLKVKPKIDVAFKKIFEDEERLKSLIVSALDLEKAKTIILKPTEITPSNPDEKFCRLDIRAEVDGREIDIEIQINPRGDFRARTLYYGALMLTKQLKSGNDYEKLPRSIVIAFVDFNPFGLSSEYHSEFQILEKKRGELLSDKLEFHFFELKKTPSMDNAHNKIEQWLNLICVETDEDLKKIETSEAGEDIKKALTEIRRLNRDDEFVRTVEAREVQFIEEMSALSAAKREANEETAKKMLKRDYPLRDIAEDTGLSLKKLEEIKKSM